MKHKQVIAVTQTRKIIVTPAETAKNEKNIQLKIIVFSFFFDYMWRMYRQPEEWISSSA